MAVSKKTGKGNDFIYNQEQFLNDRFQQKRVRHDVLRHDKSNSQHWPHSSTSDSVALTSDGPTALRD